MATLATRSGTSTQESAHVHPFSACANDQTHPDLNGGMSHVEPVLAEDSQLNGPNTSSSPSAPDNHYPADLPSRKRRKLSPQPHVARNWFDQLRSDAVRGKDHVGSKAVRVEELASDTELVDLTQPRSLSQAHQAQVESAMPATPTEPVIPNSHQQVLQLDASGKFQISKSRKIQEEITTDGSLPQAPPRKRQKKHKSLVVMLQYSVGRVSEKVANILAGSARHEVPPKEPEVAHIFAQNPNKPTHPFFAGGRVIHSKNKDEAAASEVNEPAQPKRNVKAMTTPRKIRKPDLAEQDEASKLPPVPIFNTFKLPGTFEAAWPAKEQSHVCPRPLLAPLNVGFRPQQSSVTKYRSHKNRIVEITPKEDVLAYSLGPLINKLSERFSKAPKVTSKRHSSNLPYRITMSGPQLHDEVAKVQIHDGVARYVHDDLHPATYNLIRQLPHHLGYFDKGEAESLPWTAKYAPKHTIRVLQNIGGLTILKTWLQRQTVAAVESGSSSGVSQKLHEKKHKKKRKKKTSELDDFLASSDDDLGELQELASNPELMPGSKSVARVLPDPAHGKSSNAVLISGTHGCGKTAAVYAVAAELGFEVFEINPSARRSGKDILDRVGDLALNHQVGTQNPMQPGSEESSSLPDTRGESQASISSMFAKAPARRGTKPKENGITSTKKAPKQQKQALILLEEVDVLFEEDRNFWETVLNLALHSKRPIIMTCSDESVMPMDELRLHAILRFTPAKPEVVGRYLKAMAALEGHVLGTKTLEELYLAKKMDLRASIVTLNFWCQLGLNDTKGGFDWFLNRWPPGVDQGEDGHTRRVLSHDTYSHKLLPSGPMADTNPTGEFLDEVYHSRASLDDHGLDPLTVIERRQADDLVGYPRAWPWEPKDHDQRRWWLTEFETTAYHMSCLDIGCRFDSLGTTSNFDMLDTTAPPMRGAARVDYTTSYPLIQADLTHDASGLSSYIANSWAHKVRRRFTDWEFVEAGVMCHEEMPDDPPPRPQKHYAASAPVLNHDSLLTTLAPLTTEHQPSALDGPMSVLTLDIAPYVRAIVSFDAWLERERDSLAGVDGSKKGGKRRTRAARSALEGGARETTRRERWFPVQLEVDRVLRTAGEAWPQVGLGPEVSWYMAGMEVHESADEVW